jgi:hypothetical protein
MEVDVSAIKLMDKFANIDWEIVRSFSDLPENMRISCNNISPDATMASFICFCDKHGIGMEYIAGRTGYPVSGIRSVIVESKDAGIYENLCTDFIVQG